jgi:integrase
MRWNGSALTWCQVTNRRSRAPTCSARGVPSGVRLHERRYTHASFGAGGGLGLPIIGRLLGHAQAATTARHTHLDNDPLRRASETIARRISGALEANQQAKVLPLSRHAYWLGRLFI